MRRRRSLSNVASETIGDRRARTPWFRLRMLVAGALSIALPVGVMAFFLMQAIETPPSRPRTALQRVSHDTAMDWRPQPQLRTAEAAPVD